MTPARWIALAIATGVACFATTTIARAPASAQCTIVPSGSGPEWSLALQIRNGRAPAVFRYFAPVMLRGFTVRLAGAELALAQPAIDMPVQPQTLRMAPRVRAAVPLLIRLRFRPQNGPLLSADRFVQTIDHAATRVQIEGWLGEGPSAIACSGTLDPNPPARP